MRQTIRRFAIATPFLLLLPLVALSCAQGPPLSPSEVLVASRAALPSDPGDAAWRDAPLHTAALILQDMVEPRLLEPSTRDVRVQAITDGTRVAFRLAWEDAGEDDLPGSARFSDACAVQLPAHAAADVPAPQMGEAGRPVEITYWRAYWQATVDGRGDEIEDIYPDASVDHYPFEAASLEEGSEAQRAMALRYAPARAVGNTMAGPREKPVEDLVAEGPGTLRPAERGASDGSGRRAGDGWAVVLSRPLPEGLGPGQRTQVAFAVWEGGHDEVGARKMRTGWVPLAVERKP